MEREGGERKEGREREEEGFNCSGLRGKGQCWYFVIIYAYQVKNVVHCNTVIYMGKNGKSNVSVIIFIYPGISGFLTVV